ncbi:mitochondrial sodium/calcium exchanger protein-like [Gigantopelta aegis]|uniref:mitochondrial sodium/calcium exchanger protein-like n=1 Tax=Gigantopelta aegis TaxID=1735272 RepID=UPI001B887C88|nr:mitochondrial sodium/calcium exchanger protein-like [Gigantopelta aegis]
MESVNGRIKQARKIVFYFGFVALFLFITLKSNYLIQTWQHVFGDSAKITSEDGLLNRRLKWIIDENQESGISPGHLTEEQADHNHLSLGHNGVTTTGFDNVYKGHSTDVKCSDFHKLPNITDICQFVNSTDDCKISEGFINYTLFVYCTLQIVPLALAIVFVWWLFLFVGLAVTAEDFFCPALTVISQTLHLSHNIAGVTFLAFGNGAPDIFSAIAAVNSAKNGDAGLAVGALFGAGMFVTTVIAGTISIVSPFDAMQRPFLRDVIFFLAAVFWLFYILWKQEITKYEALGFILLYVFYVLVVVIGRYIYQRTRSDEHPVLHVPHLDDNSHEQSLYTSGEQKYVMRPAGSVQAKEERTPLLENAVVENYSLKQQLPEEERTVFKQFLSSINPIDTEMWPEMRIHSKIFEIFKCPILLILKLTIPVVDYSNENKHNWNRVLNSLHCFTGPLFASLATQIGFKTLGSVFPVWGLVMIVGAALAVLIFAVTKNDEKPAFHAVFGYLGFLVAVIWIYSIANEIVNILQTFGAAFNISHAILGLTLLAWGNSLGDFISDFTMARQGYPRMGISACYGGPLFNILLGIGIPFTILCFKQGGSYKLNITLEEFVIFVFLLISLMSSLVIVPLSRFRMSRPLGVYLIILYIVFMVVVILTETGTIRGKID